MRSRHGAWPLLFAGLVPGAPVGDPVPAWYSIPVPGVERIDRVDMGLAGQDEPGGPLVDGLGNGSRSWTGMGLSYQSDRGSSGTGTWKRDIAAFDLQAVLGGEEGLAFGMQALDLQPRPVLRTDSAQWKVEDPQGGLRLGLGADALHPLGPKSGWAWAFAAWIPVYSPSLEWELQTALVRKRRFRLDLSFTWSDPAVGADLERTISDTLYSDSVDWRTRKVGVSGRAGFSPVPGMAVQAWAGWRGLRDPGAGDRSSWRVSGRSWYGGLQAGWDAGGRSLDGEVRTDFGHESARFDTVDGAGWTRPEPDEGRAEHALADGRLEARGRFAEVAAKVRVRPVASLRSSWMRLDGNGPVGGSSPWVGGGDWGELHRWAGDLGLGVEIPWFTVETRGGLQLWHLQGDPPRLWWSTASPGRTWSIPWSVRVYRETDGGSSLSYRISDESTVSGEGGPRRGLRHDLRVGQGF